MRIVDRASFVAMILWLAGAASAQVVQHREDFEQGYTHWSMTGMWNPESTSDFCGGQLPTYPSGTQCAYFGNDSVCNYDLGTLAHAGQLTWLDDLVIPNTGHVTLRFWDWREAECFSSIHFCPQGTQFDKTTVEVSLDGGMSWGFLGTTCDSQYPHPQPYAQTTVWRPHVFSLDGYQGVTVRLRFSFVTVDHMLNSLFGWAIDDVSILWDAANVACVSPVSNCPCPIVWCQTSPVSCANSTGRPSEFFATGSASVSQDSLQLLARNLPATSMVLFVEGSAHTIGPHLGDGRLCISGPYARLGIVQAQNGEAIYPPAGGLPISVVASIPASGGTRAYQAYYRDSVAYCTSATFNLTSALQLDWVP